MKVRDLMKQEIDIDVYDNVCEELAIAFCGPMILTEEGEEQFADVLDYDCEIHDDCVIVDIDYADWKRRLRKACRFFFSLAGYCDCDDYDRWFIEG